jgi:hypothetical protein
MSKRTPIYIRGRSERSSFSPSIEALQNRNRTQLLEILDAATPVIEEIAKVRPQTWRDMSGLFTALEGTFGIGGGLRQIGRGALKPVSMLKNRAMNMMEGVLAPVMIGINRIGNRVEALALQNQGGAIAGAATGVIMSFIMPGGRETRYWETYVRGIGCWTILYW